MMAMMSRAKAFLVGGARPTATEYAVTVALIVVAALVAVQVLGVRVKDMFQDLADQIGAVAGA